MKRRETTLEITSERAWLGLALLCLILPRFGRGSEDASISNFYASPAGVYQNLIVTGSSDTIRFAQGNPGAEASKIYVFDDTTKIGFTHPTNPGGQLGIGVPGGTPMGARMEVRGNVRVAGCIWINDSVKCGWDSTP